MTKTMKLPSCTQKHIVVVVVAVVVVVVVVIVVDVVVEVVIVIAVEKNKYQKDQLTNVSAPPHY